MASKWTAVTKKYRPNRTNDPVRIARKRAANVRPFQEQTGPNGFGYLYIPRSRRMDRSEVRRRLRKMDVDTSRILDITFPARNVVGLLIHAQYHPLLTETMTNASVKVLTDFDPLDPKHLADPKLETVSMAERHAVAIENHRRRCTQCLKFLRPAVMPSVARGFLEEGWIFDEDIPTVPAKHLDRDAPDHSFQSEDDPMPGVFSTHHQ
ncbi:uncharacterized protein BYT42DRAFT_586773 [Radiomyces spectabilis]|uniref:uncharacterized protein n=1 Tax=Radiomyces spectabilis TaxID=64574 RepID=UPI00221F215D|nr:uncharacterized protein BYT42DRAFT_586773 [Radiomyces spectabilis]KAI8367576.1 hypothetical protein BYT42DRAFT_586773 [Radiomyces spectabilis]